MFQGYDNRKVISQLITHEDTSYLSAELQIPPAELLNYLNQLINNLSKQVSPGVAVMPFTGQQRLQEFTSRYNKKIIEDWLSQQQRKFPSQNTIKDFVQVILQHYDHVEKLAVYFQLGPIMDFKEYLHSILITRLVEYYERFKIQIYPQTFLVAIDPSLELADFLSVLNRELAFDIVPYNEPHNIVVEFSEQRGDPYEERNKDFSPGLFIEFIRSFSLKLPPDNQHTSFVETKKKHLISAPKDEIGTFQIFKGYQSFKVLCNLKNELFESNQFTEMLQEHREKLQNLFSIEKFKILFDPTAVCEGQNKLQNELIRQLENTKINTREIKENFYRFVFMNLFCKLEKRDNPWGVCVFQNKYYQNMIVPNTWTKQIKLMLLKFKTYKMNSKKNAQKNQAFILAFFRLLGLIIQFESDFLIGLIQSLKLDEYY